MNALIIANGTLPSDRSVRKLAAAADLIICADGGANHARRLDITPDIIIGDFDSISAATRKHFPKVTTFQVRDQESTDLEKALELSLRLFITHADIVGGTGTRTDHMTGSLGCFKKYEAKIDITLFDTEGSISLVGKRKVIRTKIGESISLIPLNRCTGVSTKNLLYPLHNETLETGVREGISNKAVGTEVLISVKSGTLLLYQFHRD